MKKIILLVFVLLMLGSLFAEDYLDINFFIEPRFEHDQINMVNFLVKNIRNDSIRQVNAFAGRILAEPQSDSLTTVFINALEPEIISPVDYFFFDKSINYDLLISNIESDSIPIIKNKIIKCDSFKVGIFAIYTPDFTVKNNIADYAVLDTDIFKVAREQANFLAKQTDYVIMLSNVTKYIDNDIVKKLDVDAVVSFDYQKKSNELLSNRTTNFYSILTKNGNYGKLRLEYHNGKVGGKWEEIEFKDFSSF
ncbi:MAG: hypothetical protein KAS53_04575 [Candidatus Cloacimonetes bacterium]|nr:hypothetical protein [Candidatus Cloacimonadota bacterium]